MESLNGTQWDVVIAGTGLQESVLALALSRSGKRILHVDKHNYYGGADAALSLQEAEVWANDVGNDAASDFSHANVLKTLPDGTQNPANKLSFSRAYSFGLSPQIIYTRSQLLSSLVSARVDAQLEFLAVGSWWVYPAYQESNSGTETASARLIRVPSGREDVVADPNTGPKAKRALTKFLRFVTDFEEQGEIWENHKDMPFEEFLADRFALPSSVQQPLLALTMASFPPSQVMTAYALPRIARHLRSIGVFGPGFGAVIPKWGGLAEVAQVGCRAGAVGGGVYVLGNGLEKIMFADTASNTDQQESSAPQQLKARLRSGDTVTTRWVIGSDANMPNKTTQDESASADTVYRSISIISSPLSTIFPPLAEGSPTPAAAMISMPSSSISEPDSDDEPSQIYIMVHSADTGECPQGQSVLYASVVGTNPTTAFALLDKAILALLDAVNESPTPRVLWKLQYAQHGAMTTATNDEPHSRIVTFPPPSLDLAFDDAVLERVRKVWERIMEGEDVEFLVFPPREGEAAEEEVA